MSGKGVSPLEGGSSKALTATSIIGATVSGCPFQSPPGTSAPCVAVTVVSGQSVKVTAGGIGVVLDSSIITVSNPVAGPASAIITNAGQIALTASG